jgi:glycosyltransferase involved in cell wall biosynthesis
VIGRDPATAVTVVIATHDRLAYLKEALVGVAAQGPDIDEVIVVDDGSTDGTSVWLSEWLQEAATKRGPLATSPRLTTLRQSPAQERSRARNAGLARCDTPFVLFLDDDDVLRPGAIAALTAALAGHPDAAGSAGAYRRFGSLREPGRDLRPKRQLTTQVWREELLGWNMPPSALLWRTDVARMLGGFDPSLRHCEDRDLNLRAYPRPFVLIPQTVVDYRVHDRPPVPTIPDVDGMVRERFVASLGAAERPGAVAVLDARVHLDDGLARYIEGDFRGAVPQLVATWRLVPSLARSPLYGPWLVGLTARAVVGAALPRRWGAAIQAWVRGRRPPGPTSPEHDAVA